MSNSQTLRQCGILIHWISVVILRTAENLLRRPESLLVSLGKKKRLKKALIGTRGVCLI